MLGFRDGLIKMFNITKTRLYLSHLCLLCTGLGFKPNFPRG